MAINPVLNVSLKLVLLMTWRKMKVSSDKIYLSPAEQVFLMRMLETDNPVDAVEKLATLMVEEGADPTEISQFIKRIMKTYSKKFG